MKILQMALPIPLRQYFDYLHPVDNEVRLVPGIRLRVPLKKREVIGILIDTLDKASGTQPLKMPIAFLDEAPVITQEILKLCQWAASYYQFPVGEILHYALPKALRQGKPLDTVSLEHHERHETGEKNEKNDGKTAVGEASLELNIDQQNAVSAISQSSTFKTFLLEGVTGSGKTEVYLQSIAALRQKKQQALVLVPEIGPTPQTLKRFEKRFTAVSYHSGLSEKKRSQAWILAKTGAVDVVIGTRSAIFLPFKHLGLIIVDEEHDLSFKQQENFRYHARDVAVMRGYFEAIPVVLGSATPSLESLHNVYAGQYQHLLLPQRAGNAVLPLVQTVDIRRNFLDGGLSAVVLEEIAQHLNRGQQVMLFLNRRGFAPLLMCRSCGWTARCRQCDARMTYHQKLNLLRCHHCEMKMTKPHVCCECHEKNIEEIGWGTERLEATLAGHFPQHAIIRIDRDSTKRKGKMAQFMKEILSKQHQILIGTQMLAKGHHFPQVTLAVIIDADSGFFSGDFRALERMGQLITQVAGRAGRGEARGTVLIQTHYPHHPLMQLLLKKDYHTFVLRVLKERAEAALPPYYFLVLFRAETRTLQSSIDFLKNVKNIFQECSTEINIFGPVPAPMQKRLGYYRAQLLLQANKRPTLQKILRRVMSKIKDLPHEGRVKWSVDVDPMEMF